MPQLICGIVDSRWLKGEDLDFQLCKQFQFEVFRLNNRLIKTIIDMSMLKNLMKNCLFL